MGHIDSGRRRFIKGSAVLSALVTVNPAAVFASADVERVVSVMSGDKAFSYFSKAFLHNLYGDTVLKSLDGIENILRYEPSELSKEKIVAVLTPAQFTIFSARIKDMNARLDGVAWHRVDNQQSVQHHFETGTSNAIKEASSSALTRCINEGLTPKGSFVACVVEI